MSDQLTNYTTGAARIICVVTDRSYVAQGEGPISTTFSLETVRRLNGAGTWSCTLPDNDPATALLVPKSRLVRFWVDGNHQMTGIVEHRALALNNNDERLLTVSGRCMAGELAETPLINFSVGATTPSTNIVQGIFVHVTGYDSAVVWTGHDLDGAGSVQTDSGVVASFAGESALSALTTVAEHIGESFRVWRDGSRKLTWLGTETPDSGVRAIGHAGDQAHFYDNADVTYIQHFEVETDGYELLTQVHPLGAGQGGPQLNILGHTRTDPAGYASVLTAIRSTAAEAAIGKKIGKQITFKDIRPLSSTSVDLINAKNQLYDAGLQYLKRAESSNAVTSYRLSVSHVPEALDVGTTVQVIYADDVYEVDATLVVLEIRSRFGAGAAESHELVVAPLVRKPVGDTDMIVDRLQEAKVFQAHPQLNANAYTTAFRVFVGDDQVNGNGSIRFWFDSEIVQLQRVLLRMRIGAMVAPSRASLSDTITTEAGSVHNHTVSISPHSHTVEVHGSDNPTGNPLARVVYIEPDNDRLVAQTGSGSDNAVTSSGGGSSTPTSSNESSHTHDLPSLETDFGIFRAAVIDTLSVSELMFYLNGTLLSAPTTLGGGWYEYDLTDDLIDAYFQPINATNELYIQCTGAAEGTGKSCMIDAQLAVRSIIQGTALT